MSNTFADFLCNAGLYDVQEINESNISELIDLIGGKVKINLFCKECKEMRVFSMEPIMHAEKNDKIEAWVMQSLSGDLELLQKYGFGEAITTEEGTELKWGWKNWQCKDAVRIMTFSFKCAMNESHIIDFIVLTTDELMIKIGQYPSVADLSFPELARYKKELSKNDMNEMRRAIGLHAQGIGVGSYVYLRRILERVIEQAKCIAVAEAKIVEDEYEQKRVVERIKMLKDYLPDILVSNPTVYGIVSKGIHELSEEECIEYFPIMKECIFMILEKWEQERQQVEAEKQLSAAISKIASKIK